MKLKSLLILLALVILLSIPSIGELTDYQKGVMDGMKSGLRMGALLGRAPYDSASAQDYNNMVDGFNQGLIAIFGNNQTVIQMFWMSPFGINQAATGKTSTTVSSKPTNDIDTSQSKADKDVF